MDKKKPVVKKELSYKEMTKLIEKLKYHHTQVDLLRMQLSEYTQDR